MTTTTTATPTQRAAQMLAEARAAGLHVTVNRNHTVVTVEGPSTPNDLADFTSAMATARSILRHVRMVRPGTTWGTTTDGVGGHAGLTGGYVRLSKSGIEKRVATALVKAGSPVI